MLLKWSRGNAPSHVARHYSLKQFECGCGACVVQRIDTDLLELLDLLRDELGEDIVVLSGYRCKKHNSAVGGAPKSHHLLGLAADISAKKCTIEELNVFAGKIFQRVRVARGFIHVDVARSGSKRG